MRPLSPMVALAMLTCLLTPTLAQSQVDEDPWQKPPDGYVWPEAAKGVPNLAKTSEVLLSSLSADLQEFLNGFEIQISADEPHKVWVQWIDLNDDGQKELIIDTTSGGSGGGVSMIITRNKNGYRSIGDFQGGAIACSRYDGWYQIEGSSRGGGGNFARYLLRYNGKAYEQVRLEHHNPSNYTVEVKIDHTKTK